MRHIGCQWILFWCYRYHGYTHFRASEFWKTPEACLPVYRGWCVWALNDEVNWWWHYPMTNIYFAPKACNRAHHSIIDWSAINICDWVRNFPSMIHGSSFLYIHDRKPSNTLKGGNHVVWGLTAVITYNFLKLLSLDKHKIKVKIWSFFGVRFKKTNLR